MYSITIDINRIFFVNFPISENDQLITYYFLEH